MPASKSVTQLVSVPKNDRERIRLLLSTLREVGATAHCVETRMLVSRVLRVCDDPGKSLKRERR